ncbi:TetR/AcrR family transcriptional regulator [Pigmentiphaga sp.]|uniref:TetR/AcrR family transcriptional regulator n=1 Tax=Pigmentiphaga sp. TaxID=1977564 RepID=UPI00128BDAE0|nr:TetR/AcrR family transcriptional regulator [Pigmentiphaga sp.]MPS25482.1 TetR/AcrR family transcriptional regulator [Alcaligenaceae bacterium SAGV5]MPS54096.1 TetR/AcrR family transcriptional regulator [Alcaligenaceae bacterium SAGV3]MPT58795.1 TetR/AcrR family transcriptional regulator [Alcaligenaceae bacterium]
MNMTKSPEARRSARQRLLDAADELFYEGSIHTVGIDRVIERAGVAKASLYDTFGSKEALIQAYLLARHEARKARIADRLADYPGPRERLLGVFDIMRETASGPRFRGCPFSRAAAEAAPSAGIREACDTARNWLRDLFASLAREAGAADPETLAGQLMLLYDGASVSAHMDGNASAAAAARATAEQLVELALATR